MSGRASTHLPRTFEPNYSQISVEAVADVEDCHSISVDSLESDCERMRLHASPESAESNSCSCPRQALETQSGKDLPDIPESPTSSQKSGVFVVGSQLPSKTQSITSGLKVKYLEQSSVKMINRSLTLHPDH